MSKTVVVLRGDGIGPEILAEAIKVLRAIPRASELDFVEMPAGGACYIENGTPLPAETIEACRKADAIYKMPVGRPDIPPGIVERGMILPMRQLLDLYVNLRPIRGYPGLGKISPLKDFIIEGADYVFVRENTEGLYSRVGYFDGKAVVENERYKKNKARIAALIEELGPLLETDAMDIGTHSNFAIDRLLRYSFDLAGHRGTKKRVTVVDKRNVLTGAGKKWEQRFDLIKQEYPDIKADYRLVDDMSQRIIDPHLKLLDVVPTPNLFGDILSDLAIKTIGSLGLGASANLNPSGAKMFEPIHGSAPDKVGTDQANPIGAILSGALMLDHAFKMKAEARIVDEAVKQTLQECVMTEELGKMMGKQPPYNTTSHVGDAIAGHVARLVAAAEA